MLYSKVVKSGSIVPSMSTAINSLGASSTLSMSLSLWTIVLYKSTTILVVMLFNSLLALTIILLSTLNLNIVLSSILKLRAASFLGKSTLRFPDSLAVLIAVLYNCLALTNVLFSS
jgi:hypothetical protein